MAKAGVKVKQRGWARRSPAETGTITGAPSAQSFPTRNALATSLRNVEAEAERLAEAPTKDGKISIYTVEEMQLILDCLISEFPSRLSEHSPDAA